MSEGCVGPLASLNSQCPRALLVHSRISAGYLCFPGISTVSGTVRTAEACGSTQAKLGEQPCSMHASAGRAATDARRVRAKAAQAVGERASGLARNIFRPASIACRTSLQRLECRVLNFHVAPHPQRESGESQAARAPFPPRSPLRLPPSCAFACPSAPRQPSCSSVRFSVSFHLDGEGQGVVEERCNDQELVFGSP